MIEAVAALANDEEIGPQGGKNGHQAQHFRSARSTCRSTAPITTSRFVR